MLYFKCILNKALLFFYFSKLVWVLTKSISQSLFAKHFYFSIIPSFYKHFYHSWQYSSERSWYISQGIFKAFFVSFIIFSWWIFRHFHIWKNKITCKKLYVKKLFYVSLYYYYWFFKNHLKITWNLSYFQDFQDNFL